ncbi:MTH865 family protein [Halalkalicoccus salilacus]|uniref:MTH865 family protein n=1 Tax=Halalkalicoccus salilacus TaxID=3117459 RepID=UPI00300F36F1
MADRDELRSQLHDAFEGADYPVHNQMDLVPALPNGPATKFESGDTSFTAMEIATRLSGHQEFPYEDVDSLVDDVMAGLEKEDMI